MMEGVVFLARKPQRGDVVVFKTDGIALIPARQFWVKRIVGEPGDHVQIANGKLLINEVETTLSNRLGAITYQLPPNTGPMPALHLDVWVPRDSFFVLGDNSANSFDSRFWGFVPAKNVMGRTSFCYWPPHRIGGVK